MSDVRGCLDRYPPIADYALIGDCHTAALVSGHGSIDWYCPVRFDGPAVFSRLLDVDLGGSWRIAPRTAYRASRRYLGPTNVLETAFELEGGGRVTLTDFMPVHVRQADRRGYDIGTSRQIVRLVEASGAAELDVSLRIRGDYGRGRPAVVTLAEGRALLRADGRYLALACPGLRLEAAPDGALSGPLQLQAGERRWLSLTEADGAAEARSALTVDGCEAALARTLELWRTWAAECRYRGPYRDAVVRSALTLKLLTYEPTGAVVAAPTTSLPEEIGGSRNWDYRYTWLRDSSLILYALMTVGYHEEAADFFDWLERACRWDPSEVPQIMYAIDGARELPERALAELAGYACSRPVRVGNAAADQRQLDIYGEVLLAAELQYCRGGWMRRSRMESRPLPEIWALLRRMVEHAAARWQESDQGIWEQRGVPQHFLHSKLMCWSALDRGIKIATRRRLPAPLARWRRTRAEIRAAILARGYDREAGAFTQAFGSPALDASALQIARLGFLPATDLRVRSTVERIRAELTRNGLVYRYRTPDGLPGGEGTFVLCSFWLVDALSLEGRVEEARELFERVIGFANDVGLVSEEIDPLTGRLLGNYPQGFTHLGLVRAAVNLARATEHGTEERQHSDADRAARASRAATCRRAATR